MYIRWGKTACPDTPGVKKLYEGFAGGSFYTHTGGGTDFLCLPEMPEYWDVYQPGSYNHGYLYGAEYQWNTTPLPGMYNFNPPCVVCYDLRTTMVIPAAITCPEDWTLEYNGYLTSERHNHQGRSVWTRIQGTCLVLVQTPTAYLCTSMKSCVELESHVHLAMQ